jgi:hypothetical protein
VKASPAEVTEWIVTDSKPLELADLKIIAWFDDVK